MIIIEGPDGGGKSTLAKELSEMMDLPIMKFENIPKNKEEVDSRIEYYYDHLNAIYDRFYLISEPVYGFVLREKPMISPERFEQEWRKLKEEINPVVIFTEFKPKNFNDLQIKDWKDKDHIKQVSKNRQGILFVYNQLSATLIAMGIRTIFYDYEINDCIDLYTGMKQMGWI